MEGGWTPPHTQPAGFIPFGSYRLEAQRKSAGNLVQTLLSEAPSAWPSLLWSTRQIPRSPQPHSLASHYPRLCQPLCTIFICEGRFPADIIVMMAHLIKLFNCSGNHYHHHRCSIIHYFWRALLTSGAHSPALLKRGQISPTQLGVSAGCDLS